MEQFILNNLLLILLVGYFIKPLVDMFIPVRNPKMSGDDLVHAYCQLEMDKRYNRV